MPTQDSRALTQAELDTVLSTKIDRELFCVAYHPDWLTELPLAPLSDQEWKQHLDQLTAEERLRFRSDLLSWQALRRGERPDPSSPAVKPSPPKFLPRELRPEAPYSQALHIPSPDVEKRTIDELTSGGSVVLVGGKGQGKSWWTQHILHQLRENYAQYKTIYVNLARWSQQDLKTSLYPLLREELIRQLQLTEAESQRKPSETQRLDHIWPLLEAYHQRPECAHHKLVLALDGIDALQSSGAAGAFLSALRARLQGTPYLVLLGSLAGDPLASIPARSGVGSRTFGETQIVPDFTREQLREVAAPYKLELADQVYHSLWQLLSGQPYLCRLAMYRMLREPASPRVLLEEAACSADGGRLFIDQLPVLRKQLQPGEVLGLRAVYEREGVDCAEPVLESLRTMGLIVKIKRTGKHRLHCRLYLHLLRD